MARRIHYRPTGHAPRCEWFAEWYDMTKPTRSENAKEFYSSSSDIERITCRSCVSYLRGKILLKTEKMDLEVTLSR